MIPLTLALSYVPIADTSVEKEHIVLEGDIPSAMNPPSGCPFQTRCRWKKDVPGDLCEKEIPTQLDISMGHQIKCHLSETKMSEMEPVIKLATQ
jgi:peptide/nickel transport system ATP-binding protein